MTTSSAVNQVCGHDTCGSALLGSAEEWAHHIFVWCLWEPRGVPRNCFRSICMQSTVLLD